MNNLDINTDPKRVGDQRKLLSESTIWGLGIAISVILCIGFIQPSIAEEIEIKEYPLGLMKLPLTVSQQFATPSDGYRVLPPSIDWRDANVITPPKDQQTCGGCYSFAAIGCIEAMAIIDGAPPSLDLSEQFAISCDTDEFMGITNQGCCGGTATVFEFYKNNPSLSEAEYPFGNGDFNGDGARSCSSNPPWNTVDCPSPYPANTGWHVASWGLVSGGVSTVNQLKSALQTGPVWLGYEVFSDFDAYWWTGGPNDVYTHVGGATRGWHAVLLIGYDDSKNCWIMKNSWGNTGPSNDGTCLISYTANCSFGTDATTCTVAQTGGLQNACCFDGGSCYVTTEAVCSAAGGTWKPGQATCTEGLCTTHANGDSWGAVKARYRISSK